MYDLVIRGGLVVDGSGSTPFHADVAVQAGRIASIGAVSERGREEIKAEGAWVTPGFIDIHTHYDGQASWDETFSPSIWHGVTTLLLGSCGVGFAPLMPGWESRLINLMEGVEDIPGSALHEGIRWGWHSFPEYMTALDAMPHSLDFLAMVPHDPLRMCVMGARGEARAPATSEDIARMQLLLQEALDAGAAGFSTGRSDNHRTAEGQDTPAAVATLDELRALGQAFVGRDHGVIQVVSDFDLFRGPERFEPEFQVVLELARSAGRPTSVSWMQRDPGAEQYRSIQRAVEAGVAEGLPLYLQTAPRGIGVLIGLQASFHPLMGFPSFKALSGLTVAEQAAALRLPETKARILAERSEPLAGDGTPIPPLVDILLSRLETIAFRMFPMQERPCYEPKIQDSFGYRARVEGRPALEVLYDHLAEGDGKHLIYFPIFNYGGGSLETVGEMLTHPRALLALSDAGAHVGTVCDASFWSFVLSWWVQERPGTRLALQDAVAMLTSRNAAYLGLKDRGLLKEGLRADLNVIDPARVSPGALHLVRDLPAGGKRFLQKGEGYLGTWVNGVKVREEDHLTAARPGRLVRMGG